jgi:hypothetical protein
MRSIFTSRAAKTSAAAAIAALGLIATTTTAEAAYCAQWRHGHCVEWRNTGHSSVDPAWAINTFANVLGAVAAASAPRYYEPPPTAYYYPPPAYYAPPAYGYYAPPAYGYYGPEQPYGYAP